MVIQVIYISDCYLIAYSWYQDANGTWIQGGTTEPTWDCSGGSRLNDVINWVVLRANIIKENVYTLYKTQLDQAYAAAQIKYIEVGEITNHHTVYTAGCSLTISSDKTSSVTPGEYVTFTIQQNPPVPGKVVQLELRIPNGTYIYKGTCVIDSTGRCTAQWIAESGYGTSLYFRANIASDNCISGDIPITVNTTPPCQPPSGTRYCQPDNKTLCVWNPTTCSYDCQLCPTGLCQNSNCITQPPSGGGCTGCNLTDNYCILGSCVPKSYLIYGAIGIVALVMLR